MRIIDFFNKEGIEIQIKGNKPQILDDSNYVYLVSKGNVSVFLASINQDNQLGLRKFLFEVGEGQLLFGITTEKTMTGKNLIASGLEGTSIIKMEIHKLQGLQDETNSWIQLLKETGSLEEELASTVSIEELNLMFLKSVENQWIHELQEERLLLKEKKEKDKILINKTLLGLASLGEKGKSSEVTDAYTLIGQFLHIDIKEGSSKIRNRKIILQDEWYKGDSGPILGFMEEDNRTVALIPESPSKYLIHDVSTGTVEVANAETEKKLKNIGLVFYKPLPSEKITLKKLFSFSLQSIWPQDLFYIFLMGILGGILGIAIPIATGIVFDTIIPEGEKQQLLQIAFFLGASALASMLFQYVRSLAVLRLEGKIDSSLQAAVWDRLLGLPVPFFKQFSAGELAMRAMGISEIRRILSGVTLNSILTALFSVFNIALLFYYDSGLAQYALLLVFVAMSVTGYLGYKQIKYESQVLEISNNIAGMMLQLIMGISKFRVAGAENRAFYRWAKEFKEQRKISFKKETLRNILKSFNAFFPVFSSIVIFYFLSQSATPLEPGKFIAFNAAFVGFMISMISLSESLINANMIIPLYKRAKPILEALPEDDESKSPPSQLKGGIEVSNISFRYKEDAPLVLKDISFQIDEGEYIGIVGTSGCGKSTLLRLLLGFENPETGRIYYDGQDLEKVDIRAVRKQLGVVLQNGELMSGNIFNNIIGANPYLTMDDAWEAAKMAGMEEDINEMPMGMHTMISEGTSTISGGQKQRLIIARAIVNKPKILFFDEATSALDNKTQEIVSKSLDELKATRIVIAHRLSTIKNCDRIFVMDKGQIVEKGNFQELMNQNGIFADLARRQIA